MRDFDTANRARMIVLAPAAIVEIIGCALLAKPFLGALTWALALAILFAPLHANVEAILKYRNFAAAVSFRS